jgi:hypothetical protein
MGRPNKRKAEHGREKKGGWTGPTAQEEEKEEKKKEKEEKIFPGI